MQRISSNATAIDLSYALRNQELRSNQVENQMGSQQRIINLRDDPIAAAHAVRYQSWAERLDRYDKNALSVQADLRIQESHIDQAQSILQRINELAIQGANGTYGKDDLKNMATEINQYLGELVSIGNAKGPEGQSLFAGTKVDSNAFRAVMGHVEGSDGQVITGVEYTGSIGLNEVAVTGNSTVTANFPGNRVFWADQQKLFSAVDSQNYTVPQDTSIDIDGTKIPLRAGDNVYAVMTKINNGGVSVKASLDPVTNGLVLQTTQPHQMFLRDGNGGTVLQDLGVLSSRAGVQPPHNLHPDAREFGGSMFDAVIRLRDDLLSGKKDAIGETGLAGVQASLSNVQNTLATLGSRDSRLSFVSKRLENEKPEVVAKLSQETDLDLTKGITELKMLDATHQAALRAASKILPPTLMDYMR